MERPLHILTTMHLRCIALTLPLLLQFTLSGCGNKDSDSKKKPDTTSATAKAPTPDAVPGAPTGAHSGGMERFKEPGVYVDGKPLGVLKFGELPEPLAPVWFEERAAVSFKAGDKVHKARMRGRYTKVKVAGQKESSDVNVNA